MDFILYVGSLFIPIVLIILLFSFMLRKRRLITSAITSIVSCIVSFLLVSMWWLNYETDGVSQGFGIILYAISFGGLILAISLASYLIYRKRSAQ